VTKSSSKNRTHPIGTNFLDTKYPGYKVSQIQSILVIDFILFYLYLYLIQNVSYAKHIGLQ
jgi:hypothetical protein